MSILKLIMSPFVEFKEEKESPVKGSGLQKEQSSAVPVDTTPLSEPAASASTDSGGRGHDAYFENLIEEANAKNPLFQGTDFKEFLDSKIDVEAIADEPTRYRTAFNVLKRTGLTKERLVTTGREYINLINQDLKGFEAAYAERYAAAVAQKEQSLQKKAAELQALSEKIATLNGEMKGLSQEITNSKEQLITNRATFIKAGEEKKKELQLELEKIDQYFL